MRSFTQFIILMLVSLQAPAFEPTPFELDLEGFFYRGLPIKVIGTQELRPLGDGLWRLEVKARGPFVRQEERADFRWENNTVVPVDYRYRMRAPFEREEKHIRFQPEHDRIQVTIDGKTTTHPYNSEWFDPLSYTLLLLRDLETGTIRSDFTILNTAQAREHTFVRVEGHSLPPRAVVLSQDQPRRGITYVVLDQENEVPAHLLRWRNGSIDYQIRTLSGTVDGRRLTNLPHWPNPRRNVPRE